MQTENVSGIFQMTVMSGRSTSGNAALEHHAFQDRQGGPVVTPLP
jgi:hypothetical protein